MTDVFCKTRLTKEEGCSMSLLKRQPISWMRMLECKMINIAKLQEYEECHGYYDGFYVQKVQKGINITSDEEWILIRDFCQDIRLVQKGQAANEYIEKLNKQLREACADDETISYLKEIAKNGW